MTSPPTDIPRIELEAPCLGVGRTSRVWRGRLLEPFDGLAAGTAVAVKILRADLVGDAEAVQTLGYEREASRAIHHPALARARFLGLGPPAPPARAGHAVEDAGTDRPWLMLDLVPGKALADLLTEGSGRREPLPEPLVRAIGARLARALGAMHAAGWVHGDVKPENVRLDDEGRAVLVDLGFARRAGSPDAPVGTPLYIAPERARGGAPAASADLYALGCLLYELGVSVPPAATEAELQALRAGRISAPSEVVPRLSPLFDALVLELLSPSPASRPTAREVATVLQEGEASAWWLERLRFDPAARRDTVAWGGGHDVPLVGRDAELETLERAWGRTGGAGGGLVLLTGERGAGKSRLVAEFAQRMRRTGDPALYLYGRCNAIGDERPGAPLLKLVRRWLHLPEGAEPGPHAKALLAETVPAEVARTLEAALQPDAPGAGAAEITETVALGEWLLALGRGGPTIVFLDDVQFAGVATLGALRRLVKDLDSGRLLLVLGLRRHTGTAQSVLLAEILERASARTERIDLGPLDEAATLALVEEVFHHSVPRLRLARVLHERSDGIPGRIAEVLRLARERGWARPAAPPARGLELLVAPEDLPRPESLRVVLAARLAELSGRERVWLERAAVVGARIDPDLVARAWPRARAAQRDAALASLVRGGWLVTVGAQFRFARPVGREETLEAMRPRALLRAHGAVANALAEREDEQGKRPSYSRAFHLREAKRVDDLLRVLPGLVQRMRDGGHPHRRATLAGWGLEALDGLPLASQDRRLRRTLLEALADAADRLGEREEQRAALEALGELDIDLALEPHVAARIYVLHARHAVGGGRFGLARGFLRNALDLAERAHDAMLADTIDLDSEDRARLEEDRVEIARLMAKIETERGDYAAAGTQAKRALELARGPLARAGAQLSAAEVDLHDGRLQSALIHLAASRRALREAPAGLPERAARAATSLLAGRAWRMLGRPYRAQSALEDAAELAAQAGEGRVEVEATARLGRLMADVLEERRADLLLRDALFMARRIEDRRGEALAALFLGIFLAEQSATGATDLVGRAKRLGHELGLARVEALALAIEARLAIQRDDLDAALRLARDGQTLVDRHGAELPDRIVIGGTLGLVHDLRGDVGAVETMERSLRERIETDNAQLSSDLLRQRHRRWTVALLATSFSSEGVLYPRVHLRRT